MISFFSKFYYIIIFLSFSNIHEILSKSQCRLLNTLGSGENVAIGFPRLSNRAKSIGTLRITVLFVDFSDFPAKQTPQQVFSLISPMTENFISQNSYSKLKINFIPHYKWLRMSKVSTAYGMSPSISFTSQRNYITEASNIASKKDNVDFSTSDEIVVLTNPLATSVPYGPAFCSSPGSGITIKGKEFINSVSSGHDITNWSNFWLNHELCHTLGLPDLYAFSGVQFGYTGGWSIMGNINANAREFFAWERWLLDWISDSQVLCLSASSKGSHLENISSIEVANNVANKMAVITLSSSKALVVESRRSMGYDKISKKGILVYLVDTSIRTGSGPIKVLPINLKDESKMNNILSASQSITYANVKVQVVSSGTVSDQVKIIIS